MSSFEHKLKKYEVEPPAQVWDRISAGLAASAEEDGFIARLKEAEITPPSGLWSQVAEALDETAPQKADFATRLYTLEAPVPAQLWEGITQSLDKASSTPVVSINRKKTVYFRYAAAIVLAGAALFGILKFTGSEQNQGVATVNAAKDTGTVANGRKNALAQPDPAPEISAETDPGTEAASGQKSFAQRFPKSKQVATRRTALPATASYEDYSEQYTNPLYAYHDIVPNVADRYIMLMTPEGSFFRMSKKLGNLVCCVSGEEQDADCKSKIKQWQEKLAASPLSASADNFMDIVNLVGSLEDAGTEL
jgi:hypothetical protein